MGLGDGLLCSLSARLWARAGLSPHSPGQQRPRLSQDTLMWGAYGVVVGCLKGHTQVRQVA